MSTPDADDKTDGKNEDAPARSGRGVGALLKASRLRVGEDLRDVAAILRIRYVYLEAIEADDYDALPGTTYAIGFIRAYADHLGLDSDEVVRRFKGQSKDDGPTGRLVFPEPIPEPGIPGGAIVFVGILVAGVAYGTWYMNTSADGVLSEVIAPVPDRLAKLAPKKAATPVLAQPPQPASEPETPSESSEKPTEPTPELTPGPTRQATEPVSRQTAETAGEPPAPESRPGAETAAPEAPAEAAPEQAAGAEAREPQREPQPEPQQIVYPPEQPGTQPAPEQMAQPSTAPAPASQTTPEHRARNGARNDARNDDRFDARHHNRDRGGARRRAVGRDSAGPGPGPGSGVTGA